MSKMQCLKSLNILFYSLLVLNLVKILIISIIWLIIVVKCLKFNCNYKIMLGHGTLIALH